MSVLCPFWEYSIGMATSLSGSEMLHIQAIMAFKFKQEGTTNYCDMEPVGHIQKTCGFNLLWNHCFLWGIDVHVFPGSPLITHEFTSPRTFNEVMNCLPYCNP